MSNDIKNNNSRRDFLKISGAGVLGAFLGTQLLNQPLTAFAQENLPMLKEDEPQAKALGYHADASKVDTKKWSRRAGPEGAKQFCYNCQFYQAKGDPKKSDAAPCTIFPGKRVAAKGWCNSWVQNPKVKS